MLLFISTHAFAGTLMVPSTYTTIESAVKAADDGQVIEIAPGSYDEYIQISGDREITLQAGGPGVILTPAKGQIAIMQASGSDLELTLRGLEFDGQDSARGLVLTAGAEVIVEGCTFTNGFSGAGGGAINNTDNQVSLTVRDSVFEDNTAMHGGHIFFDNGPTVVVERSQFTGGRTTGGGGALRLVDAEATLTDLLFIDNTASNGSGGALYLDRLSNGSLQGSLFCENTASNDGGAITLRGGGSELAVVGNIFLTNRADGIGGAVYAHDGQLDATNNHFVSNSAGGQGSAINLRAQADGRRLNNLFAHNLSDSIEGNAFYDSNSPATDVRYSLFFSNIPSDTNEDLEKGIDVVGNPLLTNWSGAKNTQTCAASDVVPVVGSPAIDAGDPAFLDIDKSDSDIGAFGGPQPFYLDEDNDGAQVPLDCDDTNSAAFPNAPELCNLADDNCDGLVDNGAAPMGEETLCDGDDNDCDPTTPDSVDGDSDGVDNCDDCDDADPDSYPGALEIVGDGIDQDCNGVDLCFRDEDGDGYGNATVEGTALDCSGPMEASVGGDCNDGDPNRNPGLAEILCNGVDDDCDPDTIECGGNRPVGGATDTADGCACGSASLPSAAPVLVLLLLALRRQRGDA